MAQSIVSKGEEPSDPDLAKLRALPVEELETRAQRLGAALEASACQAHEACIVARDVLPNNMDCNKAEAILDLLAERILADANRLYELNLVVSTLVAKGGAA